MAVAGNKCRRGGRRWTGANTEGGGAVGRPVVALNQNITDKQIALHKATLNKCVYNVQAPPAIAGKMKACFMIYHVAGQNGMNTLVAGCMAKETGV